jgi:sugar lactone lactonase YvrE
MTTVGEGRTLLTGLQLPEAPRWHEGRLWLSDIRGGRVLSLAEGDELRIEAEFDEPCSGLGFLPDGSAIVALMQSSRIMRIGGAGVSLHADLGALPGTHLNDMITDAHGRAYVDRLHYGVDWTDPEILPDGKRCFSFGIDYSIGPEVTDSLALVDADGRSPRVVADGLLGPNGIAISPDGHRLIVAEWRTNRITEFEVDPQDGSLSNRTALPGVGERRPDGLCFDEAGAVWFASPHSGECVRILAGAVTDVVRPSVGERVLACVLGGDDRRTLFLMTDRKPEPSSGSVEAVRVQIPGAGIP